MDIRYRYSHGRPLPSNYIFDEKKMIISFSVESEDGCESNHELSAQWVVCPLCAGSGKHTNPSIDAHGLTREDFDEDPDFEYEYRSGCYDVQCYCCQGRRVVEEPVEEMGDALRAWQTWQDEEYADATQRDYETRHGY